MSERKVTDRDLYEALKTIKEYCNRDCITCALSINHNPCICVVKGEGIVIPRDWKLTEPSGYKAFS